MSLKEKLATLAASTIASTALNAKSVVLSPASLLTLLTTWGDIRFLMLMAI